MQIIDTQEKPDSSTQTSTKQVMYVNHFRRRSKMVLTYFLIISAWNPARLKLAILGNIENSCLQQQSLQPVIGKLRCSSETGINCFHNNPSAG